MLQFDNLTLGYDRHPALHHLHGHIPHGSLLAVVGPNGGGKSTLLKGILGQLKPLTGKVTCAAPRQAIGYLPQQSRIDRSFPISVQETVAMGLWRHCGLFGRLPRAQRLGVAAALERVITSYSIHYTKLYDSARQTASVASAPAPSQSSG